MSLLSLLLLLEPALADDPTTLQQAYYAHLGYQPSDTVTVTGVLSGVAGLGDAVPVTFAWTAGGATHATLEIPGYGSLEQRGDPDAGFQQRLAGMPWAPLSEEEMLTSQITVFRVFTPWDGQSVKHKGARQVDGRPCERVQVRTEEGRIDYCFDSETGLLVSAGPRWDQYRFEHTRAGERTVWTRAHQPGSSLTVTGMEIGAPEEVAEEPPPLTADTHLPYTRNASGHLVLQGRVGDQAVGLVLDLGAAAPLVLGTQLAAACCSGEQADAVVSGFGGSAGVSVMRAPSLEVGGLIAKDVLMGISPVLEQNEIDGILGVTLLRDATVVLDPDAAEVHFLIDAPPTGTCVPFEENDLIFIEVAAGSEQMRALVDTGNGGLPLIGASAFARAGGTLTDEQLEDIGGIDGGRVTVRKGYLPLTVAGRTFEAQALGVVDDAVMALEGSVADINLSLDVLLKQQTRIHLGAHQLCFPDEP